MQPFSEDYQNIARTFQIIVLNKHCRRFLKDSINMFQEYKLNDLNLGKQGIVDFYTYKKLPIHTV